MHQIYNSRFSSLLILFILLSLNSCQEPMLGPTTLSVSDDVRIGQAIDEEFLAYADTSNSISILGQSQYAEVYNYIDSILYQLQATGQFDHISDFNWTIRIFDQAEIETAFAAPGGYIYISKGFLGFIENEASFAAVLAHAMTVTDKRYVTEKLQERFSISYLIDLGMGATPERVMDVIDEIKCVPYDENFIKSIDIDTRNVVCQTLYDIQAFSTLVARINSAPDMEWSTLFPHGPEWSSQLYESYDVNSCGGTVVKETEYGRIIQNLIR